MANTLANSAGFTGVSVQESGKSFAAGFKSVLTAVSEKLHERAERVRALRELNGMSDRELADMGISRSDIMRVVDGDFERGE